jgi:hypothetical protein
MVLKLSLVNCIQGEHSNFERYVPITRLKYVYLVLTRE